MNEEALRELAEKIIGLPVEERIKLLDMLEAKMCTKCGDLGKKSNCWCDYSTPDY